MKKATSFRIISLTVITFLFLFSCQKNPDFGPDPTPNPPTPPTPTEPIPDLATKVVAGTISGFVTDENDAAVAGADITAGGKNTTTDKYGYFAIRDAQVTENAATVTINKTGYFKGIKTFIASTGKSAFFRIKLLPKTNAGTFTASAGGIVNITGGSSITFPTNAIINKATNTAYTGQVTLTAKPISAVDPDLNRIMPGDLRGLNTDNNIRLLTTYGMIAVELTGAGGEALQIASGKKATITMPIPVTLQAEAPATIPLWYFDEAKGLWIEEGKATKTGTNYIGEVSHFSYWNYDVPANYVKFKCTIVNQNNKPVSNALVKISVVGKTNNSGSGYTDSLGYTGGAIPNNAQLALEVVGGGGCSAFSKTFSTTNVDLDLGTITINTATSETTITGKIVNCQNRPITDGFVILKTSNISYRQKVDNGNFNFSILTCNNATEIITLLAEDITGMQQDTVQYMVSSGANNDMGSISACGVSTQEFFRFTFNGVQYSFSYPTDSVYADVRDSVLIRITGKTKPVPPSSISSDLVQIAFLGEGIANGSTQQTRSFGFSQRTDVLSVQQPFNVSITEYGLPGQFISGTFQGIINGSSAPTTNNVSGSFRVRRP